MAFLLKGNALGVIAALGCTFLSASAYDFE